MSKRTLANSGKRVVITGTGCVSPLGNNVEDTWAALIEGRSGAATIESFDHSNLDVHFACEVKGFDPTIYIPKKDQRRMDRFILLGFSAAAQAIAQAKLTTSGNVDPERVAVYLASGMGGLPGIEAQHNDMLQKGRISPFFIPQVIPNMLAGQVSINFGFKGPNFSIASACSSSAHAIGEAVRLIERGDADIAIAGGSEAAISLLGIAGFATMKALSTRNDAPQKASRPFDKDRDGFVMGEGGAVLVIESLESAEKRGAEILAEIVGYGANSDAYHMTSPSEGGEGGARCVQLALADAGLSIADVDVVNMHGTSTPQGDVAESTGLMRVFGERSQEIHCTSSKSMTGHLLGGAGAIEALFSALYLKHQIVSPTINLDHQDERCLLNYTPNVAKKASLKVALSNSFGFGGTNATLALKAI
ncbi:MAG: beta-ketoacyl-ACP synthase II [Bdellovibrionota bacterium]